MGNLGIDALGWKQEVSSDQERNEKQERKRRRLDCRSKPSDRLSQSQAGRFLPPHKNQNQHDNREGKQRTEGANYQKR